MGQYVCYQSSSCLGFFFISSLNVIFTTMFITFLLQFLKIFIILILILNKKYKNFQLFFKHFIYNKIKSKSVVAICKTQVSQQKHYDVQTINTRWQCNIRTSYFLIVVHNNTTRWRKKENKYLVSILNTG